LPAKKLEKVHKITMDWHFIFYFGKQFSLQEKKETKSKDKKIEEKTLEESSGGPKKQTRLGLEFKKDENLSEWYSQVE
jgi:hypothetical protein